MSIFYVAAPLGTTHSGTGLSLHIDKPPACYNAADRIRCDEMRHPLAKTPVFSLFLGMIILRHCESEFNRLYTLTGRDPGVADPSLSQQGRDHAQRLVQELAAEPITRILASPFTRALETAAPIAKALGITPEITPLVRERGMYSCDEGSPASALCAAWPRLDFEGLEEVWWSDLPESDRALQNRVQRFRSFMTAQPEAGQTLVVSHWWFLLGLCGDSLENGDWRHEHP
ncbi:histidine phosphatase family protein [Acetobacter indonesiensis]|uniref:histidine phosphatase family protein n=1 Tax=Acetobacter indonesiensis TaxID=104101 RepID=UPI0039EAB655